MPHYISDHLPVIAVQKNPEMIMYECTFKGIIIVGIWKNISYTMIGVPFIRKLISICNGSYYLIIFEYLNEYYLIKTVKIKAKFWHNALYYIFWKLLEYPFHYFLVLFRLPWQSESLILLMSINARFCTFIW